MSDRPRFRDRLAAFLAPDSTLAAHAPEVAVLEGLTNGNGKHAKGTSGVTLSGFSFVPNGDGTANIIRLEDRGHVDMLTAYLVSAYAYVAMRYRAEKLGEPALMVIQEDQEDSSEEWQPEHPLAPLLESPANDYDMGELLYRTSLYIDMSGAAVWVKDTNGKGLPGRLTPYRQGEFTCEPDGDRIRGKYIVETAKGSKTLKPSQVIHFLEPHPTDWLIGTSRLDVAMRWLNLSESVRTVVRDLLDKSVWPSLIVQTDPTWNPDKDGLDLFKQQLGLYGQTKGKPLVLLGGGTATVVAQQIKELLPADILNRVESIVASVFGIPAIVLQYQVGMENAPWSQMEEARRMCTEDTLDPRWRMFERILTRQLLRPLDEDPTLFIRFDRSTIKGLQSDRLEQASLASLLSRDASLNERRQLVGLDPVDDPAADEIPALQPPPPNPFAPAGTTDPDADPDEEPVDDEEEESEPTAEEEELEEEDRKALRETIAIAKRLGVRVRALAPAPKGKKQKGPLVGPNAVTDVEREGFYFSWRVLADRQLEIDRQAVNAIAAKILKGAKAADDEPDERQRKRFLTAVAAYFKGTAGPRWRKASEPLAISNALRESSAIVAELGIRFDLVQPDVVRFAIEETAFMVKNVTDTSIQGIQLTLAAGFEDGASVQRIANDIAASGTFAPSRAKLIARTEVGRAQNGAALEAIKGYGDRTGRVYEKVWDTAGDARVRDEHNAMQDEAVPVDQPFSNGLMYPSEPNCRCRSRFREVTQV